MNWDLVADIFNQYCNYFESRFDSIRHESYKYCKVEDAMHLNYVDREIKVALHEITKEQFDAANDDRDDDVTWRVLLCFRELDSIEMLDGYIGSMVLYNFGSDVSDEEVHGIMKNIWKELLTYCKLRRDFYHSQADIYEHAIFMNSLEEIEIVEDGFDDDEIL